MRLLGSWAVRLNARVAWMLAWMIYCAALGCRLPHTSLQVVTCAELSQCQVVEARPSHLESVQAVKPTPST